MPKRLHFSHLHTSILFVISAFINPIICFSQTDVLTWHNDNLRTGQNLSETILTPANVKAATFGKLFNLMVDGKVDAQPLYASAVPKAGGGTRNVLFVATEHDSVYAFDADTGAAFWPAVSMLKAGEVPSDTRGCGQVTPEIGVTATPVIDRGSGPHGTIYVVAMSKDSNGKYHQRLHALDITTGGEQFGGPVDIQATYPGTGDGSSGGTLTFDPGQYKSRPGLLIVNGVVYTSWSSHCDIRPYNGWLIGYNKLTLTQTGVLNFAPNGSEAAIWSAGAGPAADASGNIYISMANGTFDTTLNAGFPSKGDYGNAFVKVGPNAGKLTVTDYWTMYNTVSESNSDADLGSGGILLLPDVVDSLGATRHLGVGAGKDKNLYIVDRDNMGKFNPANNNNIYQELPTALGGGEFGTPAWFNGSVYVGSVGDVIRQFKVTNAKLGTSPSSVTSHSFGYPGTTPSLSANGTNNAILWAAENTNPAVLHAYDATNLATELYNSNQAVGNRDQFGAGNKFIVPTIANGKVYVGTTNSVGVFGLLAQGQTINFAGLSNKVIGSQPFTISATATSGLPVSFASLTTAVCTVSGSTVTLVTTGQCTIQASQGGDSTYTPAPNVSQSFQVTAASGPTVSVTAPSANATVSGKTVTLTATASAASGLSITSVQFKVDGNAIPGGTVTTSPYHATLDSTTLVDGAHIITAVATDSSNNTTSSAAVQIKVSNSVAPSSTEFITAVTFGTARNDYAGWIGMQFTVGSQNVTVNALGRMFIAGNTATHTVKLVNASTSADVQGGSVSVNMSGGTANKFKYAPLASPLVLTANTSYYLVSQETYGGDQWYDLSQVAGTSVATVNGSAYNSYYGYALVPPSNTSYVPVSFLYGSGGSVNSPSVAVTSPGPGQVSGSVTFSASATAGNGLQITSLQLQLDGSNFGPPNTVAASPSAVSANLNTTALSNGAHTLTAVAIDSANTKSVSAAVVINVSNGAPPPSPAFITGQNPGTAQSGFTGSLGMQFTTGSSPLTVTSLGRFCLSGNSGTHLLKLAQSNGSDLSGGSTTVSMAGCTPGQYQYANLGSPVTLSPNTPYYLMSQETNPGDAWSDYGSVTVAPGAGTVNGPSYYYSGYNTQAIPGSAYGPVNFHYTTSTGSAPSVSIVSPAAGSVSGMVNVTAQVTAGSNPVASVQFKLNGSNIGAPITSAPYTTTLDTATLTNGTTYQLTAVATDTLMNSATSPQVAITVSNSGNSNPSPLITAQSPGAASNFFSGLLGMQFTTGSSALTVSSLGRFCISGNSGSHIIKLVSGAGTDVAGASVSVAMAGCTPGNYRYQSLPASIVLAPNSTYFLVSQETYGGDQWFDYGPVTSTSAVTVNGPVYFNGFGYYGTASPGSAYVPVNLLYK